MGIDVKHELEKRAAGQDKPVKLTRNMTIADMVKALEPEIKRALPAILTPERFTRMALSAVNNTPELANCTPMSFIAALMNAAQLGLEPNTPLGQAYLIPYKNKGTLECQFQLGYKGLIDLAYRTGQIQIIQAQAVREFDYLNISMVLIQDWSISREMKNGARLHLSMVCLSCQTEDMDLRSATRRRWMHLQQNIQNPLAASTVHGQRIMNPWQRKLL